MLDKYHLCHAAAGSNRRGATHVVVMWHVCDINSVLKLQPF